MEVAARRGTWGVQMGMGTPPLMVPRRNEGLDDGLRRMVATCGPVRCSCCCC